MGGTHHSEPAKRNMGTGGILPEGSKYKYIRFTPLSLYHIIRISQHGPISGGFACLGHTSSRFINHPIWVVQ